jgi:undecaprenyl-diphosphatase
VDPVVAGSNPVDRPYFIGKNVSLIKAFILGIVQGITEFFPVSSYAHLKLANFFLEIQDPQTFVFFDLLCHLGTTLATIIFLRKDIVNILFFERKKIILFSIALLPLFPMYFLLKPLRDYLSNIEFTGIFLIITSLFIFTSTSKKTKEKKNSNSKIKDVLFIGIMQALALIPGISRSGATISAGCFQGWKIQDAVRFSFLLSIPTVLGGTFLEGLKIITKQETINTPPIEYLTGFITSFVVGFFAIRSIFAITNKRKIRPFAWYCLGLGTVLIIYFNI